MKKLFAFLLIVSLALFAACGGDTGPTRTFADFDTWNEWLEYKYGRSFGWMAEAGLSGLQAPITHNMSAEEFFFAMGLNAGWNLGNTFELGSMLRYDGGHYDILFPRIREAGFNILRVPVSWHQGASGTGAGTVVCQTLLNGVHNTVRAAHAAGLVVYINTHHDKDFFSLDRAGACFGRNGESGPAFLSYTARFRVVWQQIAERFRDYGDWLMFESLNEPTIGYPIRWDGAPQHYYDVLNIWNQTFVDIVRETGGNNAKRYLFFKSYAGKLLIATNRFNDFRVPNDPAPGPNRLVFSYHAYLPQPLTLEGTAVIWLPGQGVGSSFQSLRTLFVQARDNFMVNGMPVFGDDSANPRRINEIPVFMGETGATFHSQRHPGSAGAGDGHIIGGDCVTANTNRLMALNAIGHPGRIYGIAPFMWDNGEATRDRYDDHPNGETFAMFRRHPRHDNNPQNWGLPIDHTLIAGGSNPNSSGGASMHPDNSAADDPDFGVRTIEAFIDAVNGRTEIGQPRLTPRD